MQGWFGDGQAPAFAMDFAACWVNNPRDMIELQNAMFYQAGEWSNQLEPTSHWNSGNPTSMRPYWGWNEVPVTGDAMDDPANWDAIVIKLPAAICEGQRFDSVRCLSPGAQEQLEHDLDEYVHYGILVPGASKVHSRPGSSVLFLNDEPTDGGRKFQRRFACEAWHSPSGKYAVVSANDGTCFLDRR